MTELIRILMNSLNLQSGADVIFIFFLIIVFVLIRYIFMRINTIEENQKQLITKTDFHEILDLKLTPFRIKLDNINDILQKISETSPRR